MNSTLGTAAATDSTAYATSVQGTLADRAVQPDDLATVSTSGDYSDLSGTPTLGTSAATDSTAYATAAQGTTADSALQPGDIGVSVQGFDANTVVDEDYVSTDENFTTADHAKLDGIEAGILLIRLEQRSSLCMRLRQTLTPLLTLTLPSFLVLKLVPKSTSMLTGTP